MSGKLRTTELNDLQSLARFLVRVYKFEPSDFHFDVRLLEWKYLHPRPNWQGSRSYILEKDGNIVAHAGVCPIIFRLPTGETVSSLTIMDWGADPAVPLAGITLFRKLMAMAPTSFVIGGAAVTRQLLPRIGFRSAGYATTYAAWLRPWREFRERPHNSRSILRLLHGLAHPVPSRSRGDKQWEFVSVSEFDHSLQPILNTAKRGITVSQRTVADLNYQLKCPHPEMRGFLLTREGKLSGYFVMAKSNWEARILDIGLDSEDVNDWKYAWAAITRAARSNPGICRVRVLSTVPALTESLKWNGYWPQYKEPIMLHDPTNVLINAFPMDFHYFDGDSGY